MIAYANPTFADIKTMAAHQRDPKAELGDGYGLIRFKPKTGETVFECWPRYARLADGDAAQYPGWPVKFQMEENDGRAAFGYLPEIVVADVKDAVVQVVNEQDGDILYTRRIRGERFRAPVYAAGLYSIKVGRDRPDSWIRRGVQVAPANERGSPLRVNLGDNPPKR